MKIEEKDFILEYKELSNKFDLFLLYIKNKRDPEKRSEEFKLYGHDMSIESCLRKIINQRLSTDNDVLTFKEYLQKYKHELKQLENLLK